MGFCSVERLVVLVATVVVTVQTADYCCSPSQYEIAAGQINGLVLSTGKAFAQVNGVAMAVDYTGNRIGEEIESTTEGHTTKLKLIIDYKKDYTYIIIGQNCTKGPARGSLTQCIPKSAHFDGNVVIGNHKLTVEVYSFYADEPGVFRGNATYAVTQGECIPFSSSGVGLALSASPPIPIVTTTGFVNYSAGIKDPGRWFDIPSFCPQSTTVRPKRYVDPDESLDAAVQLMSVVMPAFWRP